MNIRDFPLAWRWTQPAHAVFSEAVLDAMHPLSSTESANIKELVRSFQSSANSLDKELFESVAQETNKTGKTEVTRWLKARLDDDLCSVFICWSDELALETTWKVFQDHWDDFCYPASDDVAVIPKSGDWVLLYSHEEFFVFGTRT
jgi:hypothetical protein